MNSRLTFWALGSVQFVLLLVMTVWSAADPLFEPMLQAVARRLTSPPMADVSAFATVGSLRPTLFVILLGVAATSLSGFFIGLLNRSGGRGNFKSLRSLLALTAIVALWLGLAVNHASLAWHGKALRLGWRISQLESVARPLRLAWPRHDGERAPLGPFMAYPFGRPTTLILLQPPSLSGQGLCVSAVERCSSGALKFQLSGVDGGDWAEWHPETSQPDSFVGGLGDRHRIAASLRLGRGWYLVRYAEEVPVARPWDGGR